jgi:hypothetical protein
MINDFSVLHFFYISKTRIHKGEWAATLLSNRLEIRLRF